MRYELMSVKIRRGVAKAATHGAVGCVLHDPAAGAPSRHQTKIGNHSLRATGITDNFKNSGALEHGHQMANYSSPRTTKLFDRRNHGVALEEYERVGI